MPEPLLAVRVGKRGEGDSLLFGIIIHVGCDDNGAVADGNNLACDAVDADSTARVLDSATCSNSLAVVTASGHCVGAVTRLLSQNRQWCGRSNVLRRREGRGRRVLCFVHSNSLRGGGGRGGRQRQRNLRSERFWIERLGRRQQRSQLRGRRDRFVNGLLHQLSQHRRSLKSIQNNHQRQIQQKEVSNKNNRPEKEGRDEHAL